MNFLQEMEKWKKCEKYTTWKEKVCLDEMK